VRGVDYQAVDLPYLDSRLSMLVVMPISMTRFEARLTPGLVARIVRSLILRPVALYMPRFRLKAHISLNSSLARLGMPTAFTDAADFSGISTQLSLKIQAVEHGADLRVDEQGTVAAAATGISFIPTAGTGGRITRLVLDHPFLALIRDDTSGAILFVARVTDPSRG
jgi:serpin B